MRPPLVSTRAEVAAFNRWRTRLEDLGIELTDADTYVVALIATREARVGALGRELARTRKQDVRLRLISAERLAAQDMARALDQAERVFGGRVEEAEAAMEETASRRRVATGRDGRRVVPFARPLSPTAQRVVAAVEAAGALSRAALRKRVRGSQGDFLRGIKEAVQAGSIAREGRGTKTSPHRYVSRRV